MKKIISVILVVILAMMCFAACGAQPASEPVESAAEDPVDEGDITDYVGTWYYYEDPQYYIIINGDRTFKEYGQDVTEGSFELSGDCIELTAYGEAYRTLSLTGDGNLMDEYGNLLYNAESGYLPADSGDSLEGRAISPDPISDLDIAGSYAGNNGGKASLSMYTSPETAVGNIIIENPQGDVIMESELVKLMDNYYQIDGENADITVYIQGGNICLEFYNNGIYMDDYVMTEHYVS